MEQYKHIDDAPSQLTVIATLLLVVTLAAFNTPLLELLRAELPVEQQTGWNASTDLWVNVAFLIEALVLCAITWKSSGLRIGDPKKWKRYAIPIAFVWIMPPLLVLSLYRLLTYTPFHNYRWPIGWWLVGSIAQELLFGGFIYGRMVKLFGQPQDGIKGAFSAAVLITAFLYSLNHWPNIQTTEHGMSPSFVQFQFLYTFVGCAWMLSIRRWTDCVWPAVLGHVLVNWLATVI
ncbi:MAG: CPBP family intramembrane glutamic endopeptidase [Planctomycetota bacterium]